MSFQVQALPTDSEDPADGIAVIIPVRGRPDLLHIAVRDLARQTVQPAQILLVLADGGQVLPETLTVPGVQIVPCDPGVPRQRNAGIAALLPSIRMVAFLEQDVLLNPHFLESAWRVLGALPDVAVLTGHIIGDGHKDGEPDPERAAELLARDALACDHFHLAVIHRPVASAPGSNMVAPRFVVDRMAFDEALTGDAWLEDYDWSRRCHRLGRVVQAQNLRLVRMGADCGRDRHAALGYSRIANPWYLWRKGVMPGPVLLALWVRALRPMIPALLPPPIPPCACTATPPWPPSWTSCAAANGRTWAARGEGTGGAGAGPKGPWYRVRGRRVRV